ncbi:MAG TPA: porin [Polyangia bacterium]
MSAGQARADLTIYDKDGWSFYTSGLVAAHYQLITGAADPQFKNSLSAAGGQILDERSTSDVRNNTITLSDIRSGFIGTQIGFGVNRQINERVRVTSFLSISMNGVNSNRGQNYLKDVDYREGWAAVEGPYGTFKFGRMFGLFASSSGEVMLMAFRYGVGHPCAINNAGISCGSSGAGPLYAGFDAAFRYTSPRLAGLQFQVAVTDPDVGVGLQMSPYPRVDTELNFDQTFGPARVRLYGQSMWDRIETSSMAMGGMPGTLIVHDVWGAMGTGIVNVGGFGLGGGGWTGKGIGERVPMEASDPANPLAFDKSANKELRLFRGFFGNVQYDYQGTVLTGGGGILFVRPTALDNSDMAANDVLKQQFEFHATLSHKFDAIVLEAEYMRWTSEWHFGEKQVLNFMGLGANYVW